MKLKNTDELIQKRNEAFLIIEIRTKPQETPQFKLTRISGYFLKRTPLELEETT